MNPTLMVSIVGVLIVADTSLGILAGIKDHTLSSAIGRSGLRTKIAELIMMITLSILQQLDSQDFPAIILSSVFSFFVFFEITSIIENLKMLGLDLTFVTKYFKK